MPSRGNWTGFRSYAKLLQFNRVKNKVLHLGWGNLWYQHRLGDERIESSLGGKDLGVLVVKRLGVRQRCPVAGQKVNLVLGCVRGGPANGQRCSYPSALVRPHLHRCVQS